MRRSTIALIAVGFAAALGAAVWAAGPSIAQWAGDAASFLTSSQDDRVQAHVTIYLEPPILIDGGAVIMAGRPMPDDEWRNLPAGRNPAADDAANPKRPHVKPGDRLFGAIASSPVTVVEFFYPQSGSYTFNFLPAKGVGREYSGSLRTERIQVGSSNRIPDPETKSYIDWPSVETISVNGRKHGPSWAREADVIILDAFDEHSIVMKYEGLRVISLTDPQIEQHMRYSK